MHDPKDVAAWARTVTDAKVIDELITRMVEGLNQQFADFEQISFYFKRAAIETWPAIAEGNGIERVMRRMGEVMEVHHAHLLHVVYGDHGYAEDVRELIHALSVNVYNRLQAANVGGRPQWNERWLECAAELKVKPDKLTNMDYISWIHARIGRKERERQAELMGVDPSQVKPYDYERWLMGNVRRRK